MMLAVRLRSFIQALQKRLQLYWYAMKLVYELSLRFMITALVLDLIISIFPSLNVILLRNLVNGLVSFETFITNPLSLAPYALAYGLLYAVQMIVTHLKNYNFIAHTQHFQNHIRYRIYSKITMLDMTYFDDSKHYDSIFRVLNHAYNKPLSLFYGLVGSFSNSIILISLVVLLLQYSGILSLFLLIGALPIFLINKRIANLDKFMMDNYVSLERRINYYEAMLIDRQKASELFMTKVGKHYAKVIKEHREYYNDKMLKVRLKALLYQLVNDAWRFILLGLTLLWVAWQFLLQRIFLEDIAALYQILIRVQSSVNTFYNTLSTIYQDLLYAHDLYQFFKLEPKVKTIEGGRNLLTPLPKNIRFENVWFKYTDSDNYILEDFNWCIPANQFVVIVGENGAGKSTLSKLICRLYDPEMGRILWDDRDIRTIPLEEWHQIISIMFQDPIKYFSDVRDNIAKGNIDIPSEQAQIERAAHIASATDFIQNLPSQYDTLLGKDFNGTDLSGGQWKRLALARTIYRNGQVFVFDEPTSSMDSWSEHQWLQDVKSLTKNHTVVIITHSMVTARYADIIFVMQDGQIVEEGTHTSLRIQGGLYAEIIQKNNL